jgi:hypothetical protein
MKSKQAAALQHLTCYIYPQLHLIGYVLGFAKLCVDTDQLSHNNSWQQATSTKTLFEPSFSTVWITCHEVPLLPTKLDKSKLRFLLCFHGLEHELHPKTNV